MDPSGHNEVQGGIKQVAEVSRKWEVDKTLSWVDCKRNSTSTVLLGRVQGTPRLMVQGLSDISFPSRKKHTLKMQAFKDENCWLGDYYQEKEEIQVVRICPRTAVKGCLPRS
jgi:hypothetical protein